MEWTARQGLVLVDMAPSVGNMFQVLCFSCLHFASLEDAHVQLLLGCRLLWEFFVRLLVVLKHRGFMEMFGALLGSFCFSVHSV